MRNSDLFNCLSNLGFSELESKIYIALLKNGEMSAYQLAKKIEISRSSIYNALEHMTLKGMTELVPNDTALYIAQSPRVLLGKLRHSFSENAEIANELLKKYEVAKYSEQYVNVKDFNTIAEKVRGILKNANREVYINTDMDLSIFYNELETLVNKGIRAVIFSFYNITVPKNCELYTHGRNLYNHDPSRIMVVCDNEVALTAGPDTDNVWQGTVTGNKLFVKLISEHIHNDIYLLRARDTYGSEMYDKIRINTEYERNNRL